MQLAFTAFCLFLSLLMVTAPARAQSLESQCRAAARAEIKGPNCRIAIVTDSRHPCAISSTGSQVMLLNDKAAQCVKRGGPGR